MKVNFFFLYRESMQEECQELKKVCGILGINTLFKTKETYKGKSKLGEVTIIVEETLFSDLEKLLAPELQVIKLDYGLFMNSESLLANKLDSLEIAMRKENLVECPECKRFIGTLGCYCPHCGKKVSLNIKRCEECQEDFAPAYKFCPNCSKPLRETEECIWDYAGVEDFLIGVPDEE